MPLGGAGFSFSPAAATCVGDEETEGGKAAACDAAVDGEASGGGIDASAVADGSA
ncbi:hypothetical protein [Streptomyces sp. NBC_01483]|uniref:hypothetical protein n=1 Tax=Streptomyces sp. NBC_01483 TaxID=2903883 RepID=UPI002E302697|nr:hypothetical protein [Streptomyces sp. NBC_01483]